jgi:hypothetical protein
MIPETWGRRVRYTHLWLPGYVATRLRRLGEGPPTDVWVAVADHFEPRWNGADERTARERVAVWRARWPGIADRHRDSEGRRPVYSFFYPQEEYGPELLEPLAEMAREGVADVEVHIHHDGDGEAAFKQKMRDFLEVLHGGHGLLRRPDGKIAFGFIHGNWALDNSRPDGRWCGLDNEISILRDLGCYADFTLPAADSPCQGGPVNVVYRVKDDPLRPRSFARGRRVLSGLPAWGDLTLVPGPLGLDFRTRGLRRPCLESGELASYRLPSPWRARLWLRIAPRVAGHVFLKLFAHGAYEQNASALLGGGLDRLFESLRGACVERGLRLHYVSAWEMFRAVEALRAGKDPLAGR